jgi:hypothetical protein
MLLLSHRHLFLVKKIYYLGIFFLPETSACVTNIPAVELDSLLARFYLGIYDLYDLFSLNVKIMYITDLSCL